MHADSFNPAAHVPPEHKIVAPHDSQEAPSASSIDDAQTIRSEELFAGRRVVLIQHAEETYRLLITRNNRLILQK